MGVIRIEVSHTDPDHPSAEVAHYGPAYDASYAATLSEITGVEDVDLLAEAEKGLQRFLDQNPDGWTARLVQLAVDNPDDPLQEQTASWVEVTS